MIRNVSAGTNIAPFHLFDKTIPSLIFVPKLMFTYQDCGRRPGQGRLQSQGGQYKVPLRAREECQDQESQAVLSAEETQDQGQAGQEEEEEAQAGGGGGRGPRCGGRSLRLRGLRGLRVRLR